ncbi:MAG TPA: hypothetical protein VGC67_02900 [Cellulomonas sp.]
MTAHMHDRLVAEGRLSEDVESITMYVAGLATTADDAAGRASDDGQHG